MNTADDNTPGLPLEMPAQMIMELAAQIQPASVVLARYGVDVLHFKTVVIKDPQFRAAFKEAKEFWNSDTNAKERITVKAQAMLEDSLMELYGMFHNASSGGTARLDAFNKMMKLARMDAGEPKELAAGGGVGRTVVVNINMGSGERVEKEVHVPINDYIEEDEG